MYRLIEIHPISLLMELNVKSFNNGIVITKQKALYTC